MQERRYDLLITGAGPTGLVLANLAGQLGLQVAIIEKEKEVYPIPRATHIDEETMRNFQLTGLMPELKQHIAPFGKVCVVDQTGRLLLKENIAQDNVQHGYSGSFFFDQPAFERILRNGLKRYSNVTTLYGAEASDIQQTDNEVILTTATGMQIKALWAVGCDGGRSLVRTALKTEMDAIEPAREWVIVDTVLNNPTDINLLPDHFRYILRKDRVTLFAYGIGTNNRWEFQLGVNEPMPDEHTILKWIEEYIPLDKIQITRIARYAHNSLIARQWKKGRILLAGDAAHMMPPFAGQGMCAGVRDAVNIAWKLDAVIKGKASEALLETYEQERKPHLHRIFNRTLFFSGMLRADNTISRLVRNIKLILLEKLPAVKNYLRTKYNIPTHLECGKLYSCRLAGYHLPQVNLAEQALLSDELTGYHNTVIAIPGTLDAGKIKAAEQKEMIVLHNAPHFSQWLAGNGVDFAIVRPDKIIFGAGKADAFYSVLAAA
jgi:3-(3-hydroxy-phenyl)propionate hydroxylase